LIRYGLKNFLRDLLIGWTWKCTWGFSHKIDEKSEETLYEPNQSPLFTGCMNCFLSLKLTRIPNDDEHYTVEEL